jgi:hypothetical protein
VDIAKYLSIGIGLGLVAVGIAMLAGYRIPFSPPKLDKGGQDRTVVSMFLFGVSYAVASLGCTIGPFIAIVLNSFTRDSFVAGVWSIAVYGLGMGLVLTALTVTLALARGGLLHVLRGAMAWVDRFAGVLLIVAGLYLAYYWTFNLTTDSGLDASGGGGLAERVEGWSTSAGEFIRRNLWAIGWLSALVVGTALVAVLLQRRRDRLAA